MTKRFKCYFGRHEYYEVGKLGLEWKRCFGCNVLQVKMNVKGKIRWVDAQKTLDEVQKMTKETIKIFTKVLQSLDKMNERKDTH
ncbi:hypothetical protein ES705_48025 [subsurface metagenome]